MNKDYLLLKFSGIYVITNSVSNKKYIGSSLNIYKRWLQHRWDLENGLHHNSHLQNAWNKYGPNSFTLTLLEKIDIGETTRFMLEERERFYIKLFKTENSSFGYNETSGGKGCPSRKINYRTRKLISDNNKGRRMSEEAKKRMSESATGRKHSDETKEKTSNTRTGKPNFKLRGRPCPEHVKEIVRKTHQGRKRRIETCNKISTSKIGVKTNKKTSSKYVGVSIKPNGKWGACINVNKRKVHLGTFQEEGDALKAYNDASLKYYGSIPETNNCYKEKLCQ